MIEIFLLNLLFVTNIIWVMLHYGVIVNILKNIPTSFEQYNLPANFDYYHTTICESISMDTLTLHVNAFCVSIPARLVMQCKMQNIKKIYCRKYV